MCLFLLLCSGYGAILICLSNATNVIGKKSVDTSNAQREFQGYDILIVDDTTTNLGVAIGFLESYGFGIRIARSGESALKKVAYDPPDLILLDILMPGLNGFETCRRLKETETTRSIPVIFMTALTSLEDKIRGFDVGAVDYVSKPLQMEELLARIRTHLHLRDMNLNLQEHTKQLEESSRVEKERLFDAVSQQRQQLRALNKKLIDVQETERKQLARELHDEMGQALTMISINLATVQQELPPHANATIKRQLAEAAQLTQYTLDQVRELSFNLRPAILDDLGLIPTLQKYLKRYSANVNIETRFEATGIEERLPITVETALFRIVQEALTNIARYAKAKTVRIALEHGESSVIATVEDDGQGFDIAQVFKHDDPMRGTGLIGMRERAFVLGGTFSIESELGEGTKLVIEIPVRNDNGQN